MALFRKTPATLCLCSAVLMLQTSCSGPALRNQFRSYNEAYAAALNQQMLLNLARLENGHPPYYLAIGAINNKFTFSSQTSAGTTGNVTDSQTDGVGHGITGGVFGLVSRTFSHVASTVLGFSFGETITSASNPEFQFIPINNETAAKQILEPISTDVFLTLYQQGYPIDQLLRVMIERMETPVLASGEQVVLVNSPTRGKPEDYGRFLRACAILRALQMRGYLSLEGRTEFDLVGPVALGASAPAGRAAPTLKDFTDAEDKGFVLRTNGEGGWLLYRKRAAPIFVLKRERVDLRHTSESGLAPAKDQADLNAFADTAIEFVKTNQTTSEIKDATAITNVIDALRSGITIQAAVGVGGGGSTRLILRSFNRAMEAVAGEQQAFETLVHNNAQFRERVPEAEKMPILRMLWPDYHDPKHRLAPPLETVRYAGKSYQITDAMRDPLHPNEHWNREVFRLMVALGSQVTVDISKFQRQVLELRTF